MLSNRSKLRTCEPFDFELEGGSRGRGRVHGGGWRERDGLSCDRPDDRFHHHGMCIT